MDAKSSKVMDASNRPKVRGMAGAKGGIVEPRSRGSNDAKVTHNSLEVSTHIEIDPSAGDGDNDELAELFALGNTIDQALRTELDSGVLESERDDVKQ